MRSAIRWSRPIAEFAVPGAILTLNAGSSSLKFAVFEAANGLRRTVQGEIENTATGLHFRATGLTGTVLGEWRRPAASGYDVFLGELLGWIEAHLGEDRLLAVGHRVVHGGADYDRPQRVTPALIAALDRLTPLAPLHQPHNLAPIRAIATARPGLPQIACFDTAFHHDMPRVATRFALPREYEAQGVRRYGFHGLSYEYIARRLREVAPAPAGGKVIAAHLGNGASLCALSGGKSMDTTMGFTALDGLMMGTRCGALDPGVILYLLQERGMTPEAVGELLYNQSGLLGVSGISSDMRTLLQSSEPRAAEAIELFVFYVARQIAALCASLRGLDALVFTAGIGENAPDIRERICEAAAWLGIALDAAANQKGALSISAPESRVAVFVIPTDEEAMIARHACDLLREG